METVKHSVDAYSMSSGGLSQFSGKNPIFLDQVSIILKINTQKKLLPKTARARRMAMKIPSTLARYIADPTIYNPIHGFGQQDKGPLRVGGRKALLSNGRRLTLADLGRPLEHAKGLKKSPRDATIESYENKNNQFTNEELLELASSSAYSNDPYRKQLELFLNIAQEIRRDAVDRLSSSEFENENFRDDQKLSAMEIYLEICAIGVEQEHLVADCKKALYRCFGEPFKHRRDVEESLDKVDRDAFLVWAVSPSLVSPALLSSKKIHVKFYRKGERVRLEFRVQSASVQGFSKEFGKFINHAPGFSNDGFCGRSMAVADELASKLRELELHFLAANRERKPLSESDILYTQIMNRIHILTPRSAETPRVQKLAKALSINGFCDRTKARNEYRISNDVINLFCDPKYGFLQPTKMGIPNLNHKRLGGRSNLRLDLISERLQLANKPPKKKRSLSKSALCKRCLSSHSNYDCVKSSVRKLIYEASGCAVPTEEVLKLAGLK